jgi:predicted nucleic acid-binding Zn ribbon protein
MPTYTYRCPICNFIYKEHREVTDPQFFTKCTNKNCGVGTYEEITK